MINTSDLNKARKEIVREKHPIIVLAQNDEFNRKILEHGKFDILLSPELSKRRNSLRQIDSGLNHVLAKIALKSQVFIGIDVDKISSLPLEEKAEALARIKQNINICKKVGTSLAINGKKSESYHLLLSLGASTEQASKALYF